MKTYSDLIAQWQDCCADLQAAAQALPPVAEVEQHLRATLEAAVSDWQKFAGRIAAELATGTGHVTLRQLTGGVDLHPALPLAGAIASFGIDRIIKTARAEAEKLPQAVRLDAAARAEAVALLSRQRFALELDLAGLHFEDGAALPESINAAALLGLPLDIAEAHGLLRWSA